MSTWVPLKGERDVRFRGKHVLQRNRLVYKRFWRGSTFFSFFSPMLFLGAMGFGIGALVNSRNPDAFPGGYLAFFATGMLASACMNTGVFEMSWPISSKFFWGRNYEAMLATPLSVRDLVFGELVWLLFRLVLTAVPFFLVMWAFGVPERATAVLAIPAACLCGLAFAAGMMNAAAYSRTGDLFSSIFRFVITPLFLFSGTFFPLDRLPTWAKIIGNATPLYHGIELVRGLMLYGISIGSVLWHVAYLTAFTVAGAALALRTYRRKLEL